MSYDLYIAPPSGGDVATQIRLLVTCEDASCIRKYVQLVHRQIDRKTGQLQCGEFNRSIGGELNRLQKLGIRAPEVSSFMSLPLGSWFVQFTFILAKPWMSKDDDPFYVGESVNPLRKDRVFKVPFMSAATCKGLLRWTAMYKQLALKKDVLSDVDFASERFRQSLLFGDEKGQEPGAAKDLVTFLDRLKPGAKNKYRSMIKEYFGSDSEKNELPSHSHRGRLTFYPSFFDSIDVEVINPHSRRTKAGTHPIYLECVPAGARSTFSLLYVPFDLIGRKNEREMRSEAQKDLELVAEAISAMMLSYGFSGKRTSGYGTAKNEIYGKVKTRAGEWELKRLDQLVGDVANVRF